MATPPVLRNESSNLSDSNVPKDPTLNETPTLFKNSQIYPRQLQNIKSLHKKSTKFKENIKILQQPLQYWETSLPIYQIQMYQKDPHKTNNTDITEKFPNLS